MCTTVHFHKLQRNEWESAWLVSISSAIEVRLKIWRLGNHGNRWWIPRYTFTKITKSNVSCLYIIYTSNKFEQTPACLTVIFLQWIHIKWPIIFTLVCCMYFCQISGLLLDLDYVFHLIVILSFILAVLIVWMDGMDGVQALLFKTERRPANYGHLFFQF